MALSNTRLLHILKALADLKNAEDGLHAAWRAGYLQPDLWLRGSRRLRQSKLRLLQAKEEHERGNAKAVEGLLALALAAHTEDESVTD